MRAALHVGKGQPLQVVDDVEIRDPRPGEVLVRVHACGLCHSDIPVMDAGMTTPIVLGHEAAGVVEAIGAGVNSHKRGDKVVLTPCPPCGSCYWCVRGEFSTCVLANGRDDGRVPRRLDQSGHDLRGRPRGECDDHAGHLTRARPQPAPGISSRRG